MSSSREAISLVDLTHLVSTTNGTTVYPSDDNIVAALQSRFRADLPYTRLGETSLVVVNPVKSLASANDASAREYEEKCYRETNGSHSGLQPHLYDLAARVYLLMRRRNESQAILFRGITGSGKSFSSRLITSQILRLSTHNKKDLKLAEQIKALTPLLDSFGHAKTITNSSASRHNRYLELHFSSKGYISAAKVLTFGLDKSRLTKLTHEERSFHVFYQLLAGATPEERDAYNLEDPSDYALLSSSGCYRLPGGPFSDDSIAMEELRASMKILGFKPKHTAAIFSLLVAILTLGNIQFVDSGGTTKDATYESARIINPEALEQAAHLLGVSPEDLEQTLTNKTNYVRKELYTIFLGADAAANQRNHLMQDLYAILFAYIVESANHRIAPPIQQDAESTPSNQIVMLDYPGFQSRAPTGSVGFSGPSPLIAAYGQNKLDEFCFNFTNELVHSYILRNTFDDAVGYNAQITSDGVSLPVVNTMDNSACVELLRGVTLKDTSQRKPGGVFGLMAQASSNFKQGKASDKKDEDLLQDLVSTFGIHSSFVTSPSGGSQTFAGTDRMLFGINHFAGNCSYDIGEFVERDTDTLDSAFVPLLRRSVDPFIAKLVSGPSLAVETHQKDHNVVVQAQVSSRPLRQPSQITSLSSPNESPSLDPQKTYPVTTQLNSTLCHLFSVLDRARLWSIACIRPNDSGSPNSFDKRRVKSQVRSFLISDFIARRQVEYSVDLPLAEFAEKYAPQADQDALFAVRSIAEAKGWTEGLDYAIGHRMIWLAFPAWKMIDDDLRSMETDARSLVGGGGDDESVAPDYPESTVDHHDWAGGASRRPIDGGSDENLIASAARSPGAYYGNAPPSLSYGSGGLLTPKQGGPFQDPDPSVGGWNSELDHKGDYVNIPQDKTFDGTKESREMVVNEAQEPKDEPITKARKWWLRFVWLSTWWIPTYLLIHVGRMKRADVRMAWREKVTICMMIFGFCGIVIFYIVVFGFLVCPEFNKSWGPNELQGHTGDNNFWVAVAGEVYDISNFWKVNHGTSSVPVAQQDMKELAGLDITQFFPVPLSSGCSGLVTNPSLTLIPNITGNPTLPMAYHVSGVNQPRTDTKLHQPDWYQQVFLPKMQNYHKGPLVHKKKDLLADGISWRKWAAWNHEVFDLSDYFNSIDPSNGANPALMFFNQSVTDLFKQQPGQDITKDINKVMAALGPDLAKRHYQCLRNNFYVGRTDPRETPRCLAPNYLLLGFSVLVLITILAKFLAALQLTSKRTPELLDKFVICQIPCYTEGEDSLRRTIDSLAALKYDDKRKLLFIICDGNIIGSGNDKPTPRIVLDILGVDQHLDPEPLLFKSVGEGSKQLNYGKVYSGLYEFEGHVVPYVVVVKVGKPSERQRPGNRGKRDSQVLLLHYLNRVHFDGLMSPLELEIYHQMRNVIGIDPAFYEYIFMVDADTSVTPDSLNRLVACTADDQSIIAICGETKLDNEEGSWWTMIQVYEYYISHHLAKAFESLFGSVTCLPGCFSMYRIRTADKGRPLIISNRLIDAYSEGIVDTLHKKNLFSLGEDRYLTTLMMKFFPTFKMKFTPDAVAHTVAPDRWSVLLSQRRRWINSTIHNLVELVLLPELCGFCCFSMRFIVFVDLLGTIILPATTVYLTYLIVIVATGQAGIPKLMLIILGIVYGFQAIIFILKREFMLVGWLVLYIIAFPVYSFFLPVYSFWCMDDFSWGNTRLVVGEGSTKKVKYLEDEKFDDSMIPLKKFSDYEAEAWETRSHHSEESRPSGYNTPSKTPSHFQNQPRSASPHSHHQTSQSGDFYRDTNLTYNNSSNPNLRLPQQHQAPNLQSRAASVAGASQFGGGSLPQLAPMPFMPFASGPGSVVGSDFGSPAMPMGGYAGSLYGMPAMGMGIGGSLPSGPRNSVATNLNMFGGGPGSAYGGPNVGEFGAVGHQRPMSMFSVATTANPFLSQTAIASDKTDPTDEELLEVLRHYLSTQDLMTVTKKTAREAVMAKFPKADLTAKKEFLNASIDRILST